MQHVPGKKHETERGTIGGNTVPDNMENVVNVYTKVENHGLPVEDSTVILWSVERVPFMQTTCLLDVRYEDLAEIGYTIRQPSTFFGSLQWRSLPMALVISGTISIAVWPCN